MDDLQRAIDHTFAGLADADRPLARELFAAMPPDQRASFVADHLDRARLDTPDAPSEAAPAEAAPAEDVLDQLTSALEHAVADLTVHHERHGATAEHPVTNRPALLRQLTTLLAIGRLLLRAGRARATVDRLLDLLTLTEPADASVDALLAEAHERELLATLSLRLQPSDDERPVDIADRAIALADLGAIEPAADVLADRPDADQLRADLETRLARRTDDLPVVLDLLRALHRRGDPTAHLAFLCRHVDRFPELLDEALDVARAAQAWDAQLELARRALKVRQGRARYNHLAEEALGQLGRALP